MDNQKAPIAIALDLESFEEIERIARLVSPYARILKVGMQTYFRDGQKAIDLVRELDCELFLDLKLHDIPNTVKGACKSLAPIAPDYLTVHAAGGKAMLEAAVEALPQTKITAVTALTSLTNEDIASWGQISIESFSSALAECASMTGVGAIVCSGFEVKKIRTIVGGSLQTIVPGIRQSDSASDDQKRTMTLTDAMLAGADVVVIGRPITHHRDPAIAAAAFSDEFRLLNAK
jgi:orotidine-5'-phosphate decarboxylase